MLAGGFQPDTISSDIHTLCIDGPAFDQVTTLSKFLCMGMPLSDVIAASTVNAAMALKRPELGSFRPGSVGDASILAIKEGAFDYVDVLGEHMTGDKRIVSEGVVVAGKWWHPKGVASPGPSARGLTLPSRRASGGARGGSGRSASSGRSSIRRSLGCSGARSRRSASRAAGSASRT
jgi:hypothetical protein